MSSTPSFPLSEQPAPLGFAFRNPFGQHVLFTGQELPFGLEVTNQTRSRLTVPVPSARSNSQTLLAWSRENYAFYLAFPPETLDGAESLQLESPPNWQVVPDQAREDRFEGYLIVNVSEVTLDPESTLRIEFQPLRGDDSRGTRSSRVEFRFQNVELAGREDEQGAPIPARGRRTQNVTILEGTPAEMLPSPHVDVRWQGVGAILNDGSEQVRTVRIVNRSGRALAYDEFTRLRVDIPLASSDVSWGLRGPIEPNSPSPNGEDFPPEPDPVSRIQDVEQKSKSGETLGTWIAHTNELVEDLAVWELRPEDALTELPRDGYVDIPIQLSSDAQVGMARVPVFWSHFGKRHGRVVLELLKTPIVVQDDSPNVDVVGSLSVRGDTSIQGRTTIQGQTAITGITTIAGDTNLQSDAVVSGDLTFQSKYDGGMRINLASGDRDNGIGTQTNTVYFRSSHHFAWYQRGQHRRPQLDGGGGKTLMRLTDQGELRVAGHNSAHATYVNGRGHSNNGQTVACAKVWPWFAGTFIGRTAWGAWDFSLEVVIMKDGVLFVSLRASDHSSLRIVRESDAQVTLRGGNSILGRLIYASNREFQLQSAPNLWLQGVLMGSYSNGI